MTIFDRPQRYSRGKRKKKLIAFCVQLLAFPPCEPLTAQVPASASHLASMRPCAAAMNAPKPSSSANASNSASTPPSPLSSRPRLSQLQQKEQQQPSTPAPLTPAPPSPQRLPRRQPPKRQPLTTWIDSIVSACDDAVGSRLSGALLQADAAAVATLRKKEEERASERNYERYQQRFCPSSPYVSEGTAAASAAADASSDEGSDDDE